MISTRRLAAPALLALSLACAGCASSDPDAADTTSVPSASAAGTAVVTTTVPAPAPTTTEAATTTVAPTITDASTTTAAVSTTAAPAGPTADDLTAWLADDLTVLTGSPGELMSFLAPGADVSAAVGADPDGTLYAPGDEFRIASVTKTFTAAAIMRLVETGRLTLDTTLAEAPITPELVDLLRGDGYDVDAMTIAQVLGHTSGLFDYAFGPDSPYVSDVLADPSHVWTREEQVRYAMDHGDPMGAPGEVFAYSDTGYVLLGDIIEHVTGTDLGTAYADLLDFAGLGLDHTYLELPGTTPRSHRVHQMFGDVDVSIFDPSIDLYGGGGLVSTTHDLAVFFEALGSGRVFDDPATFAAMLVPGPEPTYGLGLMLATVAGATCAYHDGFWGVEAATCPALGITFARSYQQSSPPADWSPGIVQRRLFESLGVDFTTG